MRGCPGGDTFTRVAMMSMRPLRLSWNALILASALIFSPGLTYAGMSVEEVKQFREYLAKAEKGERSAQELVAFHYEIGTGTPSDYSEAARWFHKAAEQGSVVSQFRLGTYYNKGSGVKKDPESAVSWFRKAAMNGNASAQIKLGECLESGIGIEKDLIEAYAFYSVASIINQDGPKKRGELRGKLSKAQIESAQRRSITLLQEIEAKKAGK